MAGWPFVRILLWDLAFALGSVFVTFALGLLCALALNSTRLRPDGRGLARADVSSSS